MALHFCSDLDLSQYFWPLLYFSVQVPYWALLISSPKEFSISPFPPTPPILLWIKGWSTLSWSTKETFWLFSLQFPCQQKGEKKHDVRVVGCFIWGKMRTVAWETASQRGLRNYFKLLQRGRGKGQYTCDFGEAGVHSVRYTFLQKFSAGLVKVTASYEEHMSTLMFLVLFWI